jgi:hypothetical protein
MRYMEEAAKPVASALILGNHRVLSPLDQFQLAALFCLINCRVEFTDRTLMAIPASDRDWLRTNFAPSPNWHIYGALLRSISWNSCVLSLGNENGARLS